MPYEPLPLDSIGLVGVVGAGTIGAGVAQCFAAAGFPVLVVERDVAATADVRERIRSGLRLARLLGSQHEDPAAVLARLSWTDRLDALEPADVVVESATEHRGLKQEIFAALDRVVRPDVLMASTTSAVPVDELASATAHPERVLGLHFMNPPPLKTTVEVVRGPRTTDASLGLAIALLDRLGKKAIVVGDRPGFVLNRIMMSLIVQAIETVEQGAADPATVDGLFENCLGHSMGPLATADLIGLDNVLDTLTVLRECTGDDRYVPPRMLVDLVRNGHCGRKSGKGFHDHG